MNIMTWPSEARGKLGRWVVVETIINICVTNETTPESVLSDLYNTSADGRLQNANLFNDYTEYIPSIFRGAHSSTREPRFESPF